MNMPDQTHNSSVQEQPQNTTINSVTQRKGSALDSFFPPVWLLVLMVAIVLVLNMFAGLKIFSLEKERAAVDALKARYESYKNIIYDIKDKEAQLRELVQRLPGLEKRAEEAEQSIVNSKALIQRADEKRNRAEAAQNEAEQNVLAAQETIATINNDTNRLRDEKYTLGRDVQDLRKEKEGLEQDIKDRGKELRIKEEQIAAIQVRVEEQKKRLQDVSTANSDFEDIRRKLTEISTAMDKTKARADTTIQDFRKTVDEIADEKNRLAGQGESLKKSTEDITRTHSSVLDTAKSLKTTEQDLNKYSLDIKNYSAALGHSIESLRSFSENLGKEIENLNDNVSSIKKNRDIFSGITEGLNISRSQLNGVAQDFVAHEKSLAESSSNLANLPDFKKNTDKFNILLSGMQNTIDEFSTLISNLQSILGSKSGSVITSIDNIERDLNDLSIKLSSMQEVLKETKNQVKEANTPSKAD
ncbi:MAG: hypothetical protein ACMUIP_13850 [bacterium]